MARTNSVSQSKADNPSKRQLKGSSRPLANAHTSSTSNGGSLTRKRVQCTFPGCLKSVARAGDLPRHLRIHDANKDDLMWRCPVLGCVYKNLQKTNVKTHVRTHTGEKLKCPDQTCIFLSGDPGSVIRHRKSAHGYVPYHRRCDDERAESSSERTDNEALIDELIVRPYQPESPKETARSKGLATLEPLPPLSLTPKVDVMVAPKGPVETDVSQAPRLYDARCSPVMSLSHIVNDIDTVSPSASSSPICSPSMVSERLPPISYVLPKPWPSPGYPWSYASSSSSGSSSSINTPTMEMNTLPPIHIKDDFTRLHPAQWSPCLSACRSRSSTPGFRLTGFTDF